MPETKNVSKKTQVILVAVIAAWVTAQIFVVLNSLQLTPYSDSASYLQWALDCVRAGKPYPLPTHIMEQSYVANPGYINLLAACIAATGSTACALWMNLVMNCALLYVLYALVRRLFGNVVSAIFVVIFCLLPSNSFIISAYTSDLPCALAGFAALLALSRKNTTATICAGFLLVVSNWIRPVGIIYTVTAIACLALSHATPKRWGALIVSVAVSCLMLAVANTAISGSTFMFSTTGGCNALLGANHTADGGYEPTVFEEGREGFVADSLGYNVFQKDSVWKRRALDWVINNPAEFAALAPRKLYMQFYSDSYHHGYLKEYAEQAIDADGHMTTHHKQSVILESIDYWIVLLLSVAGACVIVRRRDGLKTACLLAVPVMVCCILAIATVGNPRYHYPVMPVFDVAAAVAVGAILKRMEKRRSCRR